MNKTFWLRVQNNYLNALDKAIEHFRSKSPELLTDPTSTKWKEDIQNPQKLVEFFNLYDISLITTKSSGKYGHELRMWKTVIKVIGKYSSSDLALWWGIDLAFYYLDMRYLNSSKSKPIPKRRYEKKKHEDHSKKWGDQVRKDKTD